MMETKKKQGGRNFFSRHSTLVKVLVIVAVVLLIIRLLLPSIVLKYANKTLAQIPGYYGHVEDIDIALIRGAYQLNNIYINKIDTADGHQVTFFHSEVIDLSLEWKALFHGSIAGKLIFQRPMLRFTKEKTDFSKVKQDTSDFRVILKKFMPLDVNKFEVNHGEVEYMDSTSKPVISLKMTETYILALNLKNAYKKGELLPASVTAHAYVYGGSVNYEMKLNPLAGRPQFDVNAELKNANLTDFNNFFLAYGKFDIHKGNLGIYTEMAAKDGKFKGYVKPVIKDLQVYGPQDSAKGFMHQVWERIVGASASLLKNKKTKEIVTKVPIEGNFDNPDTGILDAIALLLRNAFIEALMPSIDNEINITTVKGPPEEKKGFFKQLFGRSKSKETKK